MMIQPFDLAQKIKILNSRNLKIQVMRTCSEPFDPEKPSLFDKTIDSETIDANQTIRALLGIIKLLSKELLLKEGRMTDDVWKLLKNTKELLKNSRSSIR